MSKNWSFIKIIGLGLNFTYEFEVCFILAEFTKIQMEKDISIMYFIFTPISPWIQGLPTDQWS